jgi:phenylalanyl-tRNA synthetase beta chain
MKISAAWLREWVSPKLDTSALAERLTDAGLEVASVTPVAPPLKGVLVGEIITAEPHPAADRLRRCRVKIGPGQPVEIVCGAANAAAGMHVPVALPGTTLPNGVTIEETEIRGVRSAGMLCSAQELGLGESSDGLMNLGATSRIGQSVAQLLALDDQILEVELTPNRGDCLSVMGVAREVAALTGAKLRMVQTKPIRATIARRVAVKLAAAEDCPHYVGRVIEGIDAGATTPLWMKERLRRGGMRSLHPVVDVTNYVMLELGQPMHAFDLERLNGGVQVRRARQGETLALLDGRRIETAPGSLLIADRRGALALAGIMGGQDSSVGGETRHLFLESAYFRPEAIAGRARALGLQTESSQRFERGVDFTLQRAALERATQLLLAIVGGRAGPVTEATAARHLPRVRPISLRSARVMRVLGTELARGPCEMILRRLGMRVTRTEGGWRVVPPPHRFDVRREEDLIEELARLHGYEQLPARLPVIAMGAHEVPEGRVSESRLRALLVDRDYQEVITYSFVDPKLQAAIDPGQAAVQLANPIAADMAVMRTSLWSGLLQTIAYNQNRQQTRVRVFELGRRFRLDARGLQQESVLGGAVAGPVAALQWGAPAREVDFFDLKADVEAVAGLGGHSCRFLPAEHPALHPAQAAIVEIAGQPAGMIGMLHPKVQARLGFDRAVFLFELKAEACQAGRVPTFKEISKFPSIRRDLSLIVPDTTPAQAVMDLASAVAGKLLVHLELFDQYRGKGIDSGRKSLSLGLTLQDSSRTLKDDEVEALLTKIISTLESELGAQLRQ